MSTKRTREAPLKYAKKEVSVLTGTPRPDHSNARANAGKRQSIASGELAETTSGAITKTKGSSTDAVTTYTPSPTAIRANAMVRNKTNGAQDAVSYLDRSVNDGYLTTAQKNTILSDLHLVTPNDVAKPATSLLPSQQEYYTRAASDGRYEQRLSDADVVRKANARRGVNATTSDVVTPTLISSKVPSYRSISFEELAEKTDKSGVAMMYSAKGRGLTKEELDNTWEKLQAWKDTRNKILRGQAEGPTPSYKGVSYNELAGKGGKEWIAFLYGSKGKILSKAELEKVAAEVKLWEQTKGGVTFEKTDSPFHLQADVFDKAYLEEQLSSMPRNLQAILLKANVNTLLEEVEKRYGQGKWQSQETSKVYIKRLESLGQQVKEMAVELNQNRDTVVSAADLQTLDQKINDQLTKIQMLSIIHARFPSEETYTRALQEFKEKERRDAMTTEEVETYLTALKAQKQTPSVKKQVEDYTDLLNEKLNVDLIERYTFQTKNNANAEALVQEAVNSLIHMYGGKAFLTSEHPQAAMVAYRYVFDGGIGSQDRQWWKLESEEQYQMRLEIPLMTKEEARVYLYVYGLYGFAKANAYYQSLELGKRLSESMGEIAAENVDKTSVFNSSAYSVLQKLTHSPAALATDVADVVSGKGIAPYNYHNTNLALGEAERQAASEKIATEYGLPASVVYDILMDIADYAVIKPLDGYIPGVGVLIFNIETAAKAILDSKTRGADDRTALQYGMICVSANTVFEIMPLDQMFREKIDNIPLIVDKILVEQGLFVSEEFFSELIVLVSDCILNANQSKYRKRVEELQKQGYSEKDAHKQTSDELFYDFVKSSIAEQIKD